MKGLKNFFHLEAVCLASDPVTAGFALLKCSLLGWQVLELGLEKCEFHFYSILTNIFYISMTLELLVFYR